MEDVKNKIVEFIKTQVVNAGAEGCVVGISGGIDSAVVTALCHEAFPNNTIGLIMPCNSNPQDKADAQAVLRNTPVKWFVVDFRNEFETFSEKLFVKDGHSKERTKLAEANLKSRMRMCALYYTANANNYLVAGTGNYTEIMTGYFTKYGDGGIDMEPIGGLTKTQVRKLAAYLGVPQQIIDKAPSAGLWEGQTDEDELGMTYENLDRQLIGLKDGTAAVSFNGINTDVVKLIKRSEHKRDTPPSGPNFVGEEI